MKLCLRLALATSALALGLVPATATAVSYHPTPEYHPAKPPHNPHYNPGPGPGEAAPKGKAYGFYCQGQSRKHVKGEKGTAFSRCVKAMARADRNGLLTARQACRALSKEHVKGQKGTSFSRCVKGVAQMRRDQSGSA